MINKINTFFYMYNYTNYLSFIEKSHKHLSIGIAGQQKFSGDIYVLTTKIISSKSFFIRVYSNEIRYKLINYE